MTDDSGGPRGTGAWQEQREAIAKRNLEARKRGQAERRSNEGAASVRRRVEDAREAKELDELNSQNAKRWTG